MRSFTFVNRFTTILPSRQTIRAVEKNLKTFDDLAYLNEQDKLLIRDSIQIYYTQIQRIREISLPIVGFTMGLLIYIVLAALLNFWNQILSLHFNIHSPTKSILINIQINHLPTVIPIVFFAGFTTFFLISLLSIIIARKMKLELKGLIITCTILIITSEIICYSVINASYSNKFVDVYSSTYDSLSAWVSIMIFSVYPLLFFFAATIAVSIYENIQKSRYPIAVVVARLISIVTT